MAAPPAINPRHLPELRHQLAAWYASPAAAATVARSGDMNPDQAHKATSRWSDALDRGGLYYIDTPMCEPIQHMAAQLGTLAVDAEDDLPQPRGMLLWGQRPHVPPDPSDGMRYAPDGVIWRTRGRSIEVNLLMHPAATDPPALGRSLRAGVQAHTPPGQMPEVIPLWECRIPADGRERPWSALINGDGAEPAENETVAVVRMLLATWLIVRQPASRRSLHDVEQVSASKTSARRITRSAGDPSRTVDYVTLRRYRAASGAVAGARAPAAPAGEGRTYTVQWWVSPHRITRHWPSQGLSKRVWRGPFRAIPDGCENAPVKGEDRVHILRR